ncbi:restriction endonuclease subunit S [bacterium]|nr:restriction endonuclease subunit S [bacterium]
MVAKEQSLQSDALPQGWYKTELHKIADVLSGKRLPKGKSLINQNNGYPYIRVADMANGSVDLTNIKYVPQEIIPSIRKYIILYSDIYISVAGTLGLIGTIPKSLDGANLTENANRITNIDCDRDYLKFYLQSNAIQGVVNSEMTLGAQPKLALTRIRNFEIILPPTLEEQKAIARVLSDTDALIQSLEKLIEKKKRIKEGMMQELLRPKEGWVEYKIGSIGTTYGGLSGKTKADFGEGSSQYITFLNVINNPTIDPNLFERVEIRWNENQNVVQQNDLLFNTSSETPEEVGLCSVLLSKHSELYLNSFCFGFRLNSQKINQLYLAYFFRSYYGREHMKALAQGATRYNLSKSLFNKLVIQIPDLKIQNKIAQALIDTDTDIRNYMSQMNKITKVKNGLMQQLLTGKIRLI